MYIEIKKVQLHRHCSNILEKIKSINKEFDTLDTLLYKDSLLDNVDSIHFIRSGFNTQVRPLNDSIHFNCTRISFLLQMCSQGLFNVGIIDNHNSEKAFLNEDDYTLLYIDVVRLLDLLKTEIYAYSTTISKLIEGQ